MAEQSFLEAIREGLHEEMARDPAVYVLGEDVALGGPFGVTAGLAEAYGVQRVVNTPISEGAVMGLAIGAAAVGLRLVIEIMFIDFITLAMDQLVNHAAKLHYMSGGQLKIPLTVRVQCGISGNMGAQHSQSLEAWLAHVPGLKVVAPSCPADAKGLIKAAIRDDNPVVFIEHRGLYWSRGEAAASDAALPPIGEAAVLREGEHITIATFGRQVACALEAAAELAGQGLSAEVIDLRSLQPLDMDTIVESVKKTGRLIVVHEAVSEGGIGAEIAMRVQQAAFYDLDGPILRLAAPFSPIPASSALDRFFVPGKAEIVRTVRSAFRRPGAGG